VIVNSTRLGRHLHRVIGGLLRPDPKPVPAASTAGA